MDVTKPYKTISSGAMCWCLGCHQTLKIHTLPQNVICFVAMDVAKRYKLLRLATMDVTKPYKLICFVTMDVINTYKFIHIGAMCVTKLYNLYALEP